MRRRCHSRVMVDGPSICVIVASRSSGMLRARGGRDTRIRRTASGLVAIPLGKAHDQVEAPLVLADLADRHAADGLDQLQDVLGRDTPWRAMASWSTRISSTGCPVICST